MSWLFCLFPEHSFRVGFLAVLVRGTLQCDLSPGAAGQRFLLLLRDLKIKNMNISFRTIIFECFWIWDSFFSNTSAKQKIMRICTW